jgi:hypothetical protein
MTIRAAARRLTLFAAPLAVLAAGVTGCGRPADSVTGKVTFRDSLLHNGAVILYCEDQQIIHGLIGPDGTYAIPNVSRGRVRVAVRVPSQTKEVWHQRAKLPPAVNGPVFPARGPAGKSVPMPIVPVRYELPEESGLTVTVNGGVTVFDINLAR